MNSIRLALPEASTLAGPVDALFFFMLALSALVAVAVAVLIVIFAIKYRKGSAADRAHDALRAHHRAVEWAWTLIPLAIFVGIFTWAARLYFLLYTPPAGALQIHVVAKQWMWKLQHPQGQREINELHVPRGRPVELVMTSQDVIHSFYVPAFRLKRDVVPGRYTRAWFEATAAGDYHLFCAEYCGTDHSRMGGHIVVLEPAAYERWLMTHGVDGDLAAQGARLFRQFGCSGCHGANSAVRAPKLEGIYGRPVPLADGSTAIADERYIRDSVLLPRKDVAAGYEPIMPSFAGQIDEDDLLTIIAYIKSIAQDSERAP